MAQPQIDEIEELPYLTITNIKASIDTGIDNFVEELSLRNPLKEIPVNEVGTNSASKNKIFTRVDGDYPEKKKVN